MRKFALLLAVLTLSMSCGEKSIERKLPKTMELKSHCIGQLAFGVPADFQLLGALALISPAEFPNKEPIEVQISPQRITAIEFDKSIAARMTELSGGPGSPDTPTKFKKVVSKELVIIRTLLVSDDFRSELHLLRDGVHFRISADSFRGGYEAVESGLIAFANAIDKLDSEETGINGNGFCYAGFKIHSKNISEFAKYTYQSKSHPDASMTLSVDSYALEEPKDLFSRAQGTGSLFNLLSTGPDILRKRELSVAGMTAQEVLSSLKTGRDGSDLQYIFALETVRRIERGPRSPHVHLELETGGRGIDGAKLRNSFSEDEAKGLWEAVVTTIRLR